MSNSRPSGPRITTRLARLALAALATLFAVGLLVPVLRPWIDGLPRPGPLPEPIATIGAVVLSLLPLVVISAALAALGAWAIDFLVRRLASTRRTPPDR